MAHDPSVAEHLRDVVTRLEATLYPLGWEQPPCLIGIDAGDALEVCTPPPCADPIGSLVGLDAPDHWTAVGMLATGRAHDAATDAGRHHGTRRMPEQRVRVGHFVHRSGVAVGFVRLGVEPPDVHDVRGPCGRVDDVCRRSLGLPTAPPDVSVHLFWASCWLQRVLDAAGTSPTHVATWSRVARHHIAVDPRRGSHSVAALIDAGHEFGCRGSWEALRSLVAQGRQRVPNVDQRGARWMDEGMFSRWLLEDLPPFSHLRSAVAAVVPAAVAASIDEVVDAWGLP